MTVLTAAALARTLLLMRDEFIPGLDDAVLLESLTSTKVALVADAANLNSHSAQSAYATAAMLMARSGHRVYLVAPDVALVGKQPPLEHRRLVTALLATSGNLVPGIAFSPDVPGGIVDIEVRFGDTRPKVRAHRSFALCASRWAGGITPIGVRWPRLEWPFGGLVSAALGAGEAFKVSMLKLDAFAANKQSLLARFAPFVCGTVELAPEDTPLITDLGIFEVVSGGAIANALLYCLARVLQARGHGRIFDLDIGDLTNLNRNVLMLYSEITRPKVEVLSGALREDIVLQSVPRRLDNVTQKWIAMDANMLVGVDHIPTRWLAQECDPKWLGIGATTHWSAMASFHTRDLPCAACLHPHDDPTDGPIPTVAFVSFWSGLLLAGYFLQALAGSCRPSAQQTFLTPLRPELPWRSPVARRAGCRVCSVPTTPTI